MGDTRTDSGQFYPGGKIIPRQPVRPGGGSDADAVHYYAETKTDAQKAQARKNIGALGSGDSIPLSQVDGLANALAGKRDTTDLATYELGEWQYSDAAAPRLSWWSESEASEYEKTAGWYMESMGPDLGGYPVNTDAKATRIEYRDPKSSPHVATRSLEPDGDELALVSQLPTAAQLLTPAQAAEVAKVKDKADKTSLNARITYERNETGLKDRAFNALTFDGTEYNLSTALAAVTPTASGQPRDLLIVATATAATTISFTSGTIKGDKPTIDGAGTWLITLTEYASGVWYCRQIKMEDAA